MTPKTKRLRQFKFYFKQGGDVVPLTLEPEDEYRIDYPKGVLVVIGKRPKEKNQSFTHTVNLNDLSHRRYIEWDEPIVEKPLGEPEPETEDFPFR